MIVNRSDMRLEAKEAMRGGKGTIELLHLVEPDKVAHGRLLAQITIPPKASIGLHEHKGETEYYIILDGDGIVDDGSGSYECHAGDVVVTGDGESHSILNPGDSPLDMIAIIVTH